MREYVALIALGLAAYVARPSGPAFGGERPRRVLFERGTAVYFQTDEEWEEVDPVQRKQRVLADTDMGYMFEKEGRLLSALDLWRLIRKGEDFNLVRLARVEIDPEFPLAVYGRLQAARPERVKDWYRRVFQVIAIDGDALVPDEAARKRVTELWGASAIKAGEADWVQKYYRPVE